jgi:membrane carboxypeptidase/penicillin-binding protein PbpC
MLGKVLMAAEVGRKYEYFTARARSHDNELTLGINNELSDRWWWLKHGTINGASQRYQWTSVQNGYFPLLFKRIYLD